MTSQKALAPFLAALALTAVVAQPVVAHNVPDTRTFTSSPEQVWLAWSDAALIEQSASEESGQEQTDRFPPL